MSRWSEWRIPDAYQDSNEDPERIFVPTRNAKNEAEAFEHLLTDLTDWSMREDLREGIQSDWRYAGIETVVLCDHDLEEVRHLRRKPVKVDIGNKGCRVLTECHVFEFVLP